MTRIPIRNVVLMALLVTVATLPAMAESRWEFGAPIVLNLAENGLLVTLAPPAFTGCTDGYTWYNLPGMPNLDLWRWTWVDDHGAPLFEFHMVSTPLSVFNYSWAQEVRIRVFKLEEGDLEENSSDPCEFYRTHLSVAEGLGRMNYHSADDLLNGPGVNSWGFTIQGDLNDNGYCSSGSPRLFWLQKWVTRSQTDILAAKSTASKGPTLTCK